MKLRAGSDRQRAAGVSPADRSLLLNGRAFLPARCRPHAGLGRIRRRGQRGSVLIIVLWIALGLVTITLYFANSMTLELRAADNRVAGIAADQAIEGAARYVSYVLATQATNGIVPDLSTYLSQAVPLGESHFWIIGRAGDAAQATSSFGGVGQSDALYFSLVDEGSKLNLNTASVAMIESLTNMTAELAANIVDWRDTNGQVSANGDGPTAYARLTPSYAPKNAPFETAEELRLIYGMDAATLIGEDVNRNGVMDANETDLNRNGAADSGLLEYVTVFTREPNTRSDGTARISVNGNRQELATLFQQYFSTDRANEILRNLGPPGQPFRSLLEFYIRSRMTADEFGQVTTQITANTGSFIQGRINVNTAPAPVLACVPGIGFEKADQVVAYRQSAASQLPSVAWVKDALNDDGAAIQAGPYITAESYQFSADIAALGPFGRGYRRTRFVFDTSEGTPKIIYRRDLSQLGWALGQTIRQVWQAPKDTR